MLRTVAMFAGVAALIVGTGLVQGWNSALIILNMGLVSAVMALGVNLQWGFAGLLNVGIMGFVALGGLAVVIVAQPPVTEAWAAGGARAELGADGRFEISAAQWDGPGAASLADGWALSGVLRELALAPEGLVQLLATDYKFAVSFVILVLVLLVRPTGLFAGKAV